MAYLYRRCHGRWKGSAILAVLLAGPIAPVSGQVSYTVFPASSSRASTAQPTNTSATVTLNVQDSSVKYVVRTLVHQAGMRILYDVNSPLFSKRITANVDHVKIMDALATVLKGTGLVALQGSDGETIIVRAISKASASEGAHLAGGIIVGRVIDSVSGQGLKGVSVKVAGTNLAVVTSDSGYFTLKDVPSGDQVLVVRLFGYKPAEQMVKVEDSERKTVRIVLASVPTMLSGVVTTATGQQRKVEVGNDITMLNVDSVMRVAPITSVTDLLETRVPGLTVLHSSGQPGDPSRLRLRGAGSVQLNNDPIVIVDGVRVYARQSDSRNRNLSTAAYNTGVTSNSVGSAAQVPGAQAQTGGYTAPSPVDQIDPASIETIEVLKGPSATAIYGSDAASGVIVITTKHGRAGPPHWDLALADGVNWLPGSWPTTYYRFGYDSTGNTGITGLCPWYETRCVVDSVVAFQALNDPHYTVLGHGNNQQANLTVSGGVPTVTYSITGSGQRNLGMLHLPTLVQQQYDSVYGARYGRIPGYLVRPDNYTNMGLTGALTVLPSSTMRLVLQSSLFNSTQQQSSLNNAIAQLEGEYIGPALLSQQPLIENEMERATDNMLTSMYALSMQWQRIPWLPVNATVGLNTVQRTDETYIPFGISFDGVGARANNNDTTGFYGVGHGISHDQTLTVGTTLPLSRLMTLAVGSNLYNESTADGSVSTNELSPGVSVPTQFLKSDGTNEPFAYSTASRSTYGWYVEPHLNVQSRFFATPGFRLDGGNGGSSSTSNIRGLSAFPKLDLSYLAVDRQGERPLWGFLSQLRPRLAFGLAGNQPPPQDKLRLFNVGLADYDQTANGLTTSSLQGFGNSGFKCQPLLTLDGVTTVQAVCLDLLGNTQLRPERVRDLEVGFDATLWQGRLSLSYTKDSKTTQDALLPTPLASSVDGGFTIQKNIGEIRNTGTEVTLNATILERRSMSWNVGVNLSNTNSLVVRLNPGQAPLCYGDQSVPCQGTRIVAGYPLFGVWARPIAAFADANHNGIIEKNEIRLGDSSVYVGQPNAKYQLNLNTGVTFFSGRLSANATFAYENGLTQDNAGACNSAQFVNLPNNPATPLATEAAIIGSNCTNVLYALGSARSGSENDNSTDIGLIQTVNTFRFNDLSINYIVPKAVSSWFRVPQMTIALQGSNLALHTNYKGKDPNVNAFSTVSAGDETADLGQIPQPQTWWLRMTLGNN